MVETLSDWNWQDWGLEAPFIDWTKPIKMQNTYLNMRLLTFSAKIDAMHLHKMLWYIYYYGKTVTYHTYTVYMAIFTVGFFSCQRANSILFLKMNIIYIKRILFQLHLVKFKIIWTVRRDTYTLKDQIRHQFSNVTDQCQMKKKIMKFWIRNWMNLNSLFYYISITINRKLHSKYFVPKKYTLI